jgi:hypothetical protein
MNWKEIIISALKNDKDLEIPLKEAARVAPKKIASLLVNFPERIDDRTMEEGMYPMVLSLLRLHIIAIAGEFLNRFPPEQQRNILRISIDASLKASFISKEKPS